MAWRLSLINGIAKQDSLITGTHFHLRLAHVHAFCKVRRLLVDAHRDLASLVAETLGIGGAEVNHIRVVTNALDGLAHHRVVVNLDNVILGGSAACNLTVRVCGQRASRTASAT